ncbi:hypothetical protein [Natronomonas sp. EA1]
MAHYRCRRCGREFEDGPTLRAHMRRRHPTRPEARWWRAADADLLPFEP